MMKIENNRGSATIEAALGLPIFIFAVLLLFQGIRLRMAEAVVYEAAAETVEYMAELSYIADCSYIIPKTRIKLYIDDEKLVEKYIDGGVSGLSFLGSNYLDEDGYVCLNVSYEFNFKLPVLGDFGGERSYVVRQKAYKGDEAETSNESASADDIYVFVTDNREAYHMSRDCSHLNLSITPCTKAQATKQGYSACEFCGGESKGSVLVTKFGDKYHGRLDCLGLKRTVYRVKKSQVEDLGGCERCVH